MSRLLFAAARGARIQNDDTGKQQKYVWVTGWDHGIEYSIHPEDAHLQYGPISTALREIDNNQPRYWFSAITAEVRFAIDYSIDYVERNEYDKADPIHRSLFLLILSEALADEGL